MISADGAINTSASVSDCLPGIDLFIIPPVFLDQI